MEPGQKVTTGIRPEHIQPSLATPVEGTISFVETQGRETLYDIALSDGQTLRSVQTGRQNFNLGDRVRSGLDANAPMKMVGAAGIEPATPTMST